MTEKKPTTAQRLEELEQGMESLNKRSAIMGEELMKIIESLESLTQGAIRAEGSMKTLGEQMMSLNAGVGAAIGEMDRQMARMMGVKIPPTAPPMAPPSPPRE